MEVGAFEAKTHLSRLLKRVQRGERITITKHGVPIADLVPHEVGAPPRTSLKKTVSKMLQARQGRSLGGISIRDLIDEGRR